jgi:hypothetical protein
VTGVGILLLGIGLFDLVSSGLGGGPSRRFVLAWLGAVLSATFAASLAGWDRIPCLLAAGTLGLAAPLWWRSRRPARSSLLLAIVTLLAASGALARMGEDEPGSRAVVLVGAFVFLVAPANWLVRLALETAGLELAREEDRMRGGRLIGAVERWLILILAWAGDLTAVGLVIAARSILRFPELSAFQRRSEAGAEGSEADRIRRVDPTTEYFLLGSMTSWLIAVAVSVLATRA